MPNEKSRVLTMVFTDLVDSTALKTARGDQAVGELIALHREHVTRLARESSGRVIDWAGDGCFLTFETSSAAVMFGLRLQQVHGEDAELPGVRVGVHMGEVTEKIGPDGVTPRIEGLAVDLAARIQGLARPGQVLMSSSVYQSARQRLGVDTFGTPLLWQAHGNYTLKGYDDPMDICEAGLEGLSPLQAPGASEKAQPLVPVSTPKVEIIPPRSGRNPMVYASIAIVVVVLISAGSQYFGSRQYRESADAGPREAITALAVLPFDNLMNDPEQDYFVDGMTDAITAELSKVRSLKVIARTSAMQFKGTTETAREIAQQLDVEGLVEGTVYRDGDEVRISARLIDGRTEQNLWSESYTNTIENVLNLQAEVAIAIAEEISATLSPAKREQLEEVREVNPQAHDAYLRGRFFWNQRNEASLRRALEHFNEAKGIDPEYAPAYAGAADCYFILAAYGFVEPNTALPRARAEARRALQLDPTLTEAMATLAGLAGSYEWDYERSIREFEDVLELDPNNSFAQMWYALILTYVGDLDKALELTDSAAALDPLSLLVPAMRGFCLHLYGKTDEANRSFDQALQIDPDYLPALFWSLIFVEKGDDLTGLDETIARIRILDSRHGMSTILRAISLAAHGRDEEARVALQEAESIRENEFFNDSFGVTACLLLDDLDGAHRWFTRAVDSHDWVAPSAWANVRFRELWLDPRFIPLARRLNFDKLDSWVEPETDAPIQKLAVLPFDNMSSDPEQEYFVDGMTEALIAELAKIKSIKVISRTSIMQYKDTVKSLPEIARELGVDALIEGSVMKAGNDVRITAQLVHGITDEHLWADSYTNTLENVFKLQAEVALAITDEINAVVTPEEESRLTSVKKVHPEAYTEWLRGRHFKSRHSMDGFRQARQRFERAIQLDPEFAEAYADLSLALWEPSTWGWARPGDSVEAAKEAIRHALRLDDQSSGAHAAAGFVAFGYDYDWETGERELRRALELNPANIPPYKWLVWRLSAERRFDEAIALGKQAVEQDPINTYALDALGDAYSNAGLSALAIPQRLQILAIAPENEGALQDLVVDYLRTNQPEEALRVQQAFNEARDDIPIEWLAFVYANLNRLDEATALLAELEDEDGRRWQEPLFVALAYAALGRTDTALDWVETGFERRNSNMIVLNTEWFKTNFQSLKDEPRFKAVMDKMNFPGREDTN